MGMSGGDVGCAMTPHDTLRVQMPTLFGVFTQVGEADEYFILFFFDFIIQVSSMELQDLINKRNITKRADMQQLNYQQN